MAYSTGSSNLHQLLAKAESYVNLHGHQSEVPWMCRDKNDAYYSVITDKAGIMEPVMKDGGGHPNNPINNTIKGLFFMGQRNKTESSVFGPRRLAVPSYQLLKDCNFYFSDFYCMRLDRPHYIQVVVTKRSSPADAQCKRLGLPELNPYNNKLLHLSGTSVLCPDEEIGGIRKLWVEVFYAEPLDINHLCSMKGAEMTTVISHSTSTAGGRPRSTSCSICK